MGRNTGQWGDGVAVWQKTDESHGRNRKKVEKGQKASRLHPWRI